MLGLGPSGMMASSLAGIRRHPILVMWVRQHLVHLRMRIREGILRRSAASPGRQCRPRSAPAGTGWRNADRYGRGARADQRPGARAISTVLVDTPTTIM